MMPNSVMFSILPADRIWTKDRDARKYAGPYPVVAAPPCAQFCQMRHLAKDDPEAYACAPRAVEQVREFGGVLEHPARSDLWRVADLPMPGGIDRDKYGGWAVEVRQFDWGHVSLKKTWLYIVGVEPDKILPMLKPRKTGRSVKIWWMPSKRVMEEAARTGRLPNGMKWRPEEWSITPEKPTRLWTPRKDKTGKQKYEASVANRSFLRLAYPPDFAAFLCGAASMARI